MLCDGYPKISQKTKAVNNDTQFKPTQSQMSFAVLDIVLKNKFAIKRHETIQYTYNILYLNKINENSDLIDKIFLCETLRFLFTN